MTTDEKRIKLAEALGLGPLRRQTRKGKEHPDGIVVAYKYCEGGGWYSWKPIPDYFNDLNACHQMEKKLSDNQWVTYMDNLCAVNGRQCGLPKNTCRRAVIHASADLRAEAFGKTLNLW